MDLHLLCLDTEGIYREVMKGCHIDFYTDKGMVQKLRFYTFFICKHKWGHFSVNMFTALYVSCCAVFSMFSSNPIKDIFGNCSVFISLFLKFVQPPQHCFWQCSHEQKKPAGGTHAPNTVYAVAS